MSTYKLGSHFSESGHSVGIFSFARRGHIDCEFGRLERARAPGGTTSASNLDALNRFVTEFEPDVVINQMPYEHAIAKVLRNFQSVLLISCLRNTLYSVRGNLDSYIDKIIPKSFRPLAKTGLIKSLLLDIHRRRHRGDLMRILSASDLFVMFGPPNIEELKYFVPDFDITKIRLIPNSIPQVAETVPPKEKRLLWLGRVARAQKRAELVPKIWQRVSHHLPDWTLDIVGEGPELDFLKAEMRSLGLKRFCFHGRQVPDDYYRSSPVFFMTSAFEGFPNTLIEAQSFGSIPVIFDSYPVASWIVEEGVNGFLIKPFDVDAMANRIIDVARSERREQLAQGALDSARRFHIDHVGKQWSEFFDNEVSKHRLKSDRKQVA